MPRGRPGTENSEEQIVSQVETIPPDPPSGDVPAQQVLEPEPVVERPKEKKKSRIGIELMGEEEEITVTAGEPMVLVGLKGETWEDIAIISSHGGRVKVPKDKYSQFGLDTDTNRRMRFEPPEVGGTARMQKPQFKATILKKGAK